MSGGRSAREMVGGRKIRSGAKARAECERGEGEKTTRARVLSSTGDTRVTCLDDLVSVEEQAESNAGTAQRQDPVRVVAEVGLGHDLAALGVGDVDGHEGAHGVGHVVGAVSERVADGGEDLDVAEDGLGLGVELLGVGVDLLDRGGGVGAVAHRVHVTIERVEEAILGAQAGLVDPRGVGGGLVARGGGCRPGLGARLGEGDALLGELEIDGAHDLLVDRYEEDGNEKGEAGREAERDPAVDRAAGAVADPDDVALGADLLGDALGDDEEAVDPDGEEDQNWVKLDRAREGVMRAEDGLAHQKEEQDGEDA